MKAFFKGVRKHISKLDADHLREQYELMSDEFARTEMLLHALTEGIVRIDAKGNILQANPAAKNLLGDDTDAALRMMHLPRGRASKTAFEVSYPERRSLEVQTLPLGEDTIVIVRDTTAEQQRTKEELRAGATRAVQDLAAGVAHEIGNPLNAISLNLQILERDLGENESISICLSQVKRLDGIIRSFLNALRSPAPKLAPGSPADPLKNCLATMKRQFEERRISVTLDIPAALPAVALDKTQMEQVFFNLVKNALEAMTDGSQLSVSLGYDDKDVSVAFADNGPGMDAEQLSHLFEPYRTTKENGSGLGLMITKRIIEAHSGTITAESEIGHGSTFTIRLPRLEKRIRELN